MFCLLQFVFRPGKCLFHKSYASTLVFHAFIECKTGILLFTRVHCMQSGCFPFRFECKVGVFFFFKGKAGALATSSAFLRERVRSTDVMLIVRSLHAFFVQFLISHFFWKAKWMHFAVGKYVLNKIKKCNVLAP